ncbi:MAG: prepilin-type N-terminal cleavage/methylation domain-containing protein [Acidobacteria bacterium]|nr:prepilin-type N-terminal cleavage/methylation domain-containing protein [Acidobacteriota bacterium]
MKMSCLKDSDHDARGFTLVEMLLSILILAIVSGGVFTTFNNSQLSYQSHEDVAEVISKSRFSMDQLMTYFRQAGNDPQGHLASNAISPIEILGTGHVRINSDLTGSVPDPSDPTNPLKSTGDPDGTLDNLYEQVVARYDSAQQRIYLDIGYGEEILASDISSFDLTFYDSAGNTTVTESEIVRVRAELVAESAGVNLESGKVQTMTLGSSVMLRSKVFRMF